MTDLSGIGSGPGTPSANTSPPAAEKPPADSTGGASAPSAPSIPASAMPSPALEACKRDRLKLVLSLAAMGYLALVTLIYGYCLIRGLKIDGEAANGMGILAGGASMLVKDAYSFVFGSSQGSEDKNSALAAQVIGK